MIGINTPEYTEAPGDAINRAAELAENIAGQNYRMATVQEIELRRANGTLSEWLGGAAAVIVTYPNGYAIHDVRWRCISTIRARVYRKEYGR